MRRKQPFYLVGATASGKSGVAAELARRCGGVVVNADAFQLYRGLPVISAQPEAKILALAPHRLFGVWELVETGDAARYAAMAREEMDRLLDNGVLPILTGGSGLYLKALTHGLSDLPRDASLRAELDLLSAEERGEKLRSVDEVSWRNIDPANLRYVTRALEISLLAGRPASELRREWKERPASFHGASLTWERADLHARIARRVWHMAAAGAAEEALSVGDVSVTAEKAIGFREWRARGLGEISLDETVALVQQATRQYAKRQETWFRKEEGFTPFPLNPEDDAADVAERILQANPYLR